MKLYLAGPLFTTPERAWNEAMAARLETHGHEVYVPHLHPAADHSATSIFLKDKEGIDWADGVVAIMDGADPDSGTCWECGYAYGKKPVIVFRTDFRVGEEPGKGAYNLMLTVSATRALLLPFADVETVARRLGRALAALPPRRGRRRRGR